MGRNDEDWAVFWCSLLSPVLLGEIPEAQRERYFQKLSRQERRLPNGQLRCISVRTFRRKWRRLKDEGVPGLYRRRRSDRGTARKKHAALLDRAVELKKEQPRRSAKVINRILKREFGRTVPRSTLYHHLRRKGATRRKLGVSKEKVRCRWTRDTPGALWVGDFEHGPLVVHHGCVIETHLSAWIDCHSRYVVEGRYYVRDNLDILADSLLRAWGNHGASRALYVDNAKVYHAQALRVACARLHIRLLHRKAGDPPPGGQAGVAEHQRHVEVALVQHEPVLAGVGHAGVVVQALAVIPGDRWVRLHGIQAELGRALELAPEQDVMRLFSDCDPGAVPCTARVTARSATSRAYPRLSRAESASSSRSTDASPSAPGAATPVAPPGVETRGCPGS